MPARHAGRLVPSRRLRWAAAAVAVAITGAAVFSTTAASASPTTTSAQLSLSGVATKASILGGSLVGIHPGDTVDFTSSGLPTAGLDNIPALGKLVQNLLSPLLGQFQVVLHTGTTFPGGARNVVLGGPTSGPCKGAKDLPVTFPKAGTYNFTWSIQYVLPGLLGCSPTGVSNANLNLLKGAGVALNAANQWVGQVVAADDPPKGGIGLQLPGIQIAPSLPVVGQLPPLGVTIPPVQLPVTVPSLPGSGGGSSGGNGGGSSGGNGGGGGLCVPCIVMTSPGGGGGGGAPAPDANSVTQIGSGLSDPRIPGSGGSNNSPSATPASPTKSKHVELASNKAPAASMPVVLAIIAIIALSLVTATYARLFLLRRNV